MKSKNLALVLIFVSLSSGLIYRIEKISTISYKESNLSDSLFTSSFEDTHILEWNLTWGSSVYAMASDSLGNIYITGITNYTFPADWDIYLAKFNSSGHLQWNQTWGGNNFERLYEIAFDSFNNIYLGGFIEETSNYNRFLLVKFNSLGHYQWNQTWGGSIEDYCYGMALDSLDNIYLVGSSHNFTISADMCLVKFNSLGQYQWNRTWGEDNFDRGHDIVIDPLDNIYITGLFGSITGGDSFLVKYDNLGQYQWNRTYNINTVQQGVAIALDSLNNIYIGGLTTNISLLEGDMLLLKYSQSGILLWDRTWEESGINLIYDIAVGSDDTIYVAGGVNNSEIKDFDFTLIQCDDSGIQQFNQTWGGSNQDFYVAISIDSSDNIYLAGTKDSTKGYLGKYSRDIEQLPSGQAISFGNVFTIYITFSAVILIVVLLKRQKLSLNLF